MIFAQGRIRQDIIGNAAVGDRILAHVHRHWHYRRHRLDARNIDFRKLLDEGEHGIELAAQMFDLIIGNRDARQMRDAADGIGVDGHAKTLAFIGILSVAIPEVAQRANGRAGRSVGDLSGLP
jgi:hypothetical protein